MWVHCPRASNGLLPRRSNLVGYVRWDAQSDRFLLARQSFQQLSGRNPDCSSYVQNRSGQHYERNRLISTVDSPVRYVRDMDVHSEDLPLQRSRISAAAGHWLSAVQDAAKVRTVTPRFWI